jgi:hypothetical protein
MAKNIVNGLVIKLPDIAVNTLAAVAVSKLTTAVVGKQDTPSSSSGAKPATKPATQPAPTGAQAADAGAEAPQAPQEAPKSALPAWVAPVGIGVGVLALGGIVLAATRKSK